MTKFFEIDGATIEATSILYTMHGSHGQFSDGILVHDEFDGNCNGDAIYSGKLEWIDTAEDLLHLMEDHGETVFRQLPDGSYYVGDPMSMEELAQALFDSSENGSDPMCLDEAAWVLDHIQEWDDLPFDLTPESVQEAYNDMLDEQAADDAGITRASNAKRISVNNGNTFWNATEAASAIAFLADRVYIRGIDAAWDAIVSAMDDETREKINDEYAPCSKQEFLARYLKAAPEDLIIG